MAIARLLLLVLPRVSAAAKHLGITVALCSVMALPIIGLAVPAWRVAVLPAQAAAQPAANQVAGQPNTIGATGDDDELPRSTVAAALTVAKASGVVPEAKLNAFSSAVDTVKGSWLGFIFIAVFSTSLALPCWLMRL